MTGDADLKPQSFSKTPCLQTERLAVSPPSAGSGKWTFNSSAHRQGREVRWPASSFLTEIEFRKFLWTPLSFKSIDKISGDTIFLSICPTGTTLIWTTELVFKAGKQMFFLQEHCKVTVFIPWMRTYKHKSKSQTYSPKRRPNHATSSHSVAGGDWRW